MMRVLLEELLLLGTSVCVFLCCRAFLQRGLYNDLRRDALPESATTITPKPIATKSWHSVLSQSSFSICFTECSMLFAMLLCQGSNLLDPSVRSYTWRASLLLLLLTIIVLIPASFYLVLTHRIETPSLLNIKSISFLFPVALLIFILSFIPLPAELTSYNPLTSTAARLVVLGTIDLGLLSGLGAVNGAWGIFTRSAAVPSAASVASAENALERVRSDLHERARDLDAYGASKPQTDGSWLWRVTFKRDARKVAKYFAGDIFKSFSPDHGSLQREIIGLQALESHMTTRVASLKRNRESNEFALSIRGRILSGIWTAYCVCRMFSSVVNLLFPPLSADDKTSSYGDIIAHVFAYMVSLLPAASGQPSVDVPSLSRQISLVLVGAIILSSVRVVLRGVTRAFRITSRNISASLMLLLLAQLMGIYLLTTLVQLRTMFPPSHSSSIDGGDGGEVNLFSSLPQYSLFGGLFDWSFLFGATGCGLTRWAGGWFSGDDEDYVDFQNSLRT